MKDGSAFKMSNLSLCHPLVVTKGESGSPSSHSLIDHDVDGGRVKLLDESKACAALTNLDYNSTSQETIEIFSVLRDLLFLN